MNRYLTLAAATLALTSLTVAPAAAEETTAPATEATTVSVEPMELKLGDEYFSLDINDHDGDTDAEVFNSILTAPGATETRQLVIKNEGKVDHDVTLWATNGKVVGDPLWAQQTKLSATAVLGQGYTSSVTGLVSDPTNDQVSEADDKGLKLYSGTLKAGEEDVVDLTYIVPAFYDENGNAEGGTGGNSAECQSWPQFLDGQCEQSEGASVENPAADDTGFSFDLLVTSQHLTVPTGEGPGWRQHMEEPFAWILTAVGALLAVAFLGFRSTIRSSIRSSAPKETAL